jgi:Family of unknown function (DUF6084)
VSASPEAVPAYPAPEFAVTGVEPLPHAAVPTLVFALRATEPGGFDVATIALTAQIHIDPARRTYDEPTRELLVDLFGEPERWPLTTESFLWARASALVPSFTGETGFELHVPCTYDLEVAATKYFYSLPGGLVPITMHFSGTVLYRSEDGRLQMVQAPWSTAKHRFPVDVWRRAIEAHYSGSGWVRLGNDTLERLVRRKAELGLPSFDATVERLLGEGS